MVKQIYAILMVLPAFFSYRTSISQEADNLWLYTNVVAVRPQSEDPGFDEALAQLETMLSALPIMREKLPTLPHPPGVELNPLPAGGEIAASFSSEEGKFDDAGVTTFRTSISTTPLSKLALNAILEWNDTKSIVYSLDGYLALNSRLKLSGKIQASELYESSVYDIRLTYEFQYRSFLKVAFNNDEYPEGFEDEKISNRPLFVKLAYVKQF